MLLHVHNGELHWLSDSMPHRPAKQDDAPLVDALGRAIEVGQVAVHFQVTGHAMASHPVVIRKFNETGTIAVDLPGKESHYDEEKKEWVHTARWKKSTVKVPAYLVIVNMTEEQIRERYGIPA